MQLFVLGSGSRGNALIVEDGDEAILVDAGFGPRELARRAEAIRFPLERIRAVLVTHEHQDHSRGATRIAQRLGATVLTTAGTWRALRPTSPPPAWRELPTRGDLAIGRFHIEASHTSHDAREPVAVALRTESTGGKLVVAYDMGYANATVQMLLRDATCLVLEANHDDLMLLMGPYPESVRNRIASSRGHLSNSRAARLLAAVCHPGLKSVVLVHLSEQCNTPESARDAVAPALAKAGFRGEIHVATQHTPLGPIPVHPE